MEQIDNDKYDDETIRDIVLRVIPVIQNVRIQKLRALESLTVVEGIRPHTIQMCELSINNFADDLINLLKETISAESE